MRIKLTIYNIADIIKQLPEILPETDLQQVLVTLGTLLTEQLGGELIHEKSPEYEDIPYILIEDNDPNDLYVDHGELVVDSNNESFIIPLE